MLGTSLPSRVYASTIIVTTNANSGVGTLRQALLDASDGDTIEFNLGVGNESITVSSSLSVPYGKSLTIDGNNSAGSGVDVTVQVTTPGSSTFQAITIHTGSGKTTTLKNMTFRGGNISTGSGGTIYMFSTGASLVLENCTVKDGRARFGAGIWTNSFDSLTITNSSIQNNTSTEHGAGMRVDSFSGTGDYFGYIFCQLYVYANWWQLLRWRNLFL